MLGLLDKILLNKISKLHPFNVLPIRQVPHPIFQLTLLIVRLCLVCVPYIL